MGGRDQAARERLRKKLDEKRAQQNDASSGQQRSQQACPLAKGTLTVIVTRSDTNAPIAGASVAITGATPGNGGTDALGAAIFQNRDPGPYTATVKFPGNLSHYRMTSEQRNGSVSANQTTTLWFKAAPVGTLVIEVYDDRGRLVKERATLSASGASALSQAVQSGTHHFDEVACGRYDASASVPAERYEPANVVAKDKVTVPEGGTARVRLEVKRLITTVKPKIEMEYKVVVLDRKLSAQQEATETKIVTDDVTYIQVSASQSDRGPRYAGGGTFQVTPANVKVYTDKACKNELAGGKLTKDQLSGAPFVLYLKAVTKGKFNAKLTLDPSNDAHIVVEGPAQEEMGVVELEATLHRYDKGELEALEVDPANDPIATYHTKLKDIKLKDQKALSDEQKVKEGRYLHAQIDKNHARAKLVVKKLVAGQWPGGTDDYYITFKEDNASGSVKLFDKETEGTEKATAEQRRIKVKDLKAKELELWVEGATETDKARGVVLGLGLDREAGGLAKEPKRNGDWSRFTVVKIESVEFTATSSPGKPKVWNSGSKRYYINTEAGAAGRTLGDKPGERDVKIVAKLTKAIADVPIHFMLAPHPDNAAPAGMPGTWKAETLKVDMRRLDRKDRKALMHFSEKTGNDGKAEMKKLVLSAFGGDKFTPAAYIEQDPHLAKYVQDHADLGSKKPKLCADTIQVWKRFDYKILYMKRHDGTSYSNRFTEANLQAKFEADFIEMERVGAVVNADHQDYVLFDTARDWVTGKLGADETRVIKLAFVDGIGNAAASEMDLSTVGVPGLSFTWPVAADEPIDLSAQNKWLKSAVAGTAGHMHPIPNAAVTLAHDGVNYKLSVDLTGIAALSGVALPTIAVEIVLLRHEGPSGLSWGPATLVSMRYRESGFPGQEDTATAQTTFHEVGHYLALAPKTLPDTGASASSLWYNSPGVGNHCKYGPQDCALWHEFILKINFCPTCKLALRARDHAAQVNADTPF